MLTTPPTLCNLPSVTLGDASLTTEDLALLVPPAWLNDHIISFWLEHLRLNTLENDDRVAILLPNLVFFLSLTQDQNELEDIARVHQLPKRDLIILPVNDSNQANITSASTPSGSHWTLLVFERATNMCYYLDSMPLYNRQLPHHLVDRIRYLAKAPNAPFVPLPVKPQTNSYDCGAYVCIYAEAMVNKFLQRITVATVSEYSKTLTQEDVDIKRQDIGRIVCRLVDERQKAAATSS